jgi:CRP-like cAMP-binding protein
MSELQENFHKNELLRRMSADDFALLQPHLQRCALELKMTLEMPNSKIEAVYFPEEGVGSVIARTLSNSDAEVGFVGFEGMTGSSLVMDIDYSPHVCRVQLAGVAVRIAADPFTAALRKSPTLRLFLLRYVHYLHVQTSFTALTNARSKLEDRLARWLLMCDDRVVGGRFAITHEFLSVMLGVRRPGVTVALQLLEGRGLIRAQRGEILVRDRDGLLALTDGYGQSEAEYIKLIGQIAWR